MSSQIIQLQINPCQIKSAIAEEGEPSSDFAIDSIPEDLSSQQFVESAILIGLIDRSDGLSAILTKRAANLAHHAGQISFPGGRMNDADQEPVDTALRESREEIGLTPDQVTILGRCPSHQTTTGFNIHPFVGLISREFTPVLQVEEVDELFEVPFDFLVNLNNFQIKTAFWKGTKRKYFVVSYKGYYIWGATAAILFRLAQRLANYQE